MIMRVLQSEWNPFVEALCHRSDVESAGIVLAERLGGDEFLRVRRLQVIPDEAYHVRQIDHLRIDPVAINRMVRGARDAGLSVFTVHTHPGTTAPWFSRADDAGDARLMPSLLAQMAGPHGSIVLAGETGVPAVRAWTGAGVAQAVGLRVVGTLLQVFPALSEIGDEEWFDRQRLALGPGGQGILRDLHIVIVGLGGTGSAVLVQLAHLGIGRITVIDGDRVESANVSRVFGATRYDVGVSWKVDVAARYVAQLGLGTELTVVRSPLGDIASLVNVEHADLIFSCVDVQTPRALLNRLSYRSGVPLIDMGSAFRVDAAGRMIAGAGRVVIVGPGRPCLGCWGHLDPARLRIEALSPDERAHLTAEGYVNGANIAQPSVIAFNTQIAGAAVVEMLRMVTGFAGVDDPPSRLAFNFLTGAVRRNTLRGAADCSICGTQPHHDPSRHSAGRV